MVVNVFKVFLFIGVCVFEVGFVFVVVWFCVFEEGYYLFREEGGFFRFGGLVGVDVGEVGDDFFFGFGVVVYYWSLYVCVLFGG